MKNESDKDTGRKIGRKRAFQVPTERVSGYIPRETARRFKKHLYEQDEFATLTELLNHILITYLDEHDTKG